MKRLLLPVVFLSAVLTGCSSTETSADGQAMAPEAASTEGGCCSEGGEKAGGCCSEGAGAAGSGAAELKAPGTSSCCQGDGPKTGCADCAPATAAPVEPKGTN